MRNINHDLVQQLSEALDSIWRFEMYKKEAGTCAECRKLWDALTQKYREIESMLVAEIQRHAKEGTFN